LTFTQKRGNILLQTTEECAMFDFRVAIAAYPELRWVALGWMTFSSLACWFWRPLSRVPVGDLDLLTVLAAAGSLVTLGVVGYFVRKRG
jgi:hypothetical protein